MKEVTVKIPEDQYDFFLQLANRLGFEIADQEDVPEWQKNLVRERMEEYRKNPALGLDFEDAMRDLEKDL